jgi:hypothetical protein
MTFIRGKPRPPGSGRRAGTPNRNTDLQRHLVAPADDQAIIDSVVTAAKAGDHIAQAIYCRYFRPTRPRLNPTPITTIIPETIEDVRAVTAELLAKVLGGELDLDAANAASAFLKAMESSIVGFDLAKLLDELRKTAPKNSSF